MAKPSPPPVSEVRIRVGGNVRRLRKAMEDGMSQEKLGEVAECHRTYVSQLERGKTNISIDRLDRFAHIFGVDIAELFVMAPPVED